MRSWSAVLIAAPLLVHGHGQTMGNSWATRQDEPSTTGDETALQRREPAGLGRLSIERMTGIEPATSTLARKSLPESGIPSERQALAEHREFRALAAIFVLGTYGSLRTSAASTSGGIYYPGLVQILCKWRPMKRSTVAVSPVRRAGPRPGAVTGR